MSTPVDRDRDVRLGRAAMTAQLLTGPQLVEALLVQSTGGFRRTLGELLQKRGLLSSDQFDDLALAVKAGAGEVKAPPEGTDPDPQARIGQIIEKVKVDRLFETIPFISTYLGRLPHDPLPAALHLIGKPAMRFGLWMDFLETVRACQDLDHPNLVKVLEVGRTDDHFAVVTRYPKGGISLRSLLDRVRRLKLSEALRILGELAGSLRGLHAASLCHRDVKPENVVLGKAGEVQLWRAGVVFEPDGAQEFSDPRSVFGSMHSIAPEAIRGEGMNPASDVYGLGVLAYELVCGVRPFEGESFAQLRQQHLEEEPIPPHQVMKALPEEVGDLLVWMLSKKPSDRPTPDKLTGTIQALGKKIKRSGTTTRFQAFDPNS